MADAADHASDDEDLDAPLRGGTPAVVVPMHVVPQHMMGRPVSLFNVAATAELINCLVAKIEELQAENATLQEALRRVSKT